MVAYKSKKNFSYADIADVNEEWYQTMLRKLAIRFVQFRKAKPFVQQKPLEEQFKLFWLHKGPTAFSSNEDTFRFKKELLAYITDMLARGDDDGGEDTAGQSEDSSESGVRLGA